VDVLNEGLALIFVLPKYFKGITRCRIAAAKALHRPRLARTGNTCCNIVKCLHIAFHVSRTYLCTSVEVRLAENIFRKISPDIE
jgi:hypothetical protein